MKFKGTIIITDPCYVIKDYSEKKPDFNTYPGLQGISDNTPFSEFTAEQINAYNEYEQACEEYRKEYDDWRKCDYGHSMEKLGITNYITESTIYGDLDCTTYKISEDPKIVVDKLAEAYRKETDYGVNCESLGDFCADAGLVSVFLLSEVLAYNPDFSEWMEKHPQCVTTIKDFDGDIEYYVDEENEAHIIGTGSINFFTAQTSL